MPRRREPPLRRIGLFGGTFDPPHLGHLALAEWARERLGLDHVLFVPAGRPPHKRGARLSSAAARVAMTRLAVRGNPAFRLSTIEVRRGGPSFTVDTLRALRARHAGARLFLIMGEDSLDDFATWREPAAIARLATLAVARRPGAVGSVAKGRAAAEGRVREAGVAASETQNTSQAVAASPASRTRPTGLVASTRPQIVWLDNPGIELSSSAVRARARAGRSIRYLVPDAVAVFVARRRLYRRGAR